MNVGHSVVNKDGREGVIVYVLRGSNEVIVNYDGIDVAELTYNLTVKEPRTYDFWRVYKKNGHTLYETGKGVIGFEANVAFAWEGDTLIEVKLLSKHE